MNNKDFQYRETYFIVGNPATLWILILGLVSFGTRSNRSSYRLWWDCRGDAPDLLNLLDLILFGSDLNLEHAFNNLRYHTSLIRLIAQEGKENKPLLVLIMK
ncbi:hypothetical protein D3C75_652120 [compost metagenome]